MPRTTTSTSVYMQIKTVKLVNELAKMLQNEMSLPFIAKATAMHVAVKEALAKRKGGVS